MALTGSVLPSFTKFFDTKQDIWAQAMEPNKQVSLQIETSPGIYVPILIPASGDPVCLTDSVPFEALKVSPGLRTLCNPRRTNTGKAKPAALKLMSHPEAEAHFARKAVRRGYYVLNEDGTKALDEQGAPIPDVVRASQPVMMSAAELASPRVSVDSKGRAPTAPTNDTAKPTTFEDKKSMVIRHNFEVTPWIMQLCVDLQTEEDRPMADDVLDRLDRSIAELSSADLQHVMAMGHYNAVKTWASQALAAQASSES